MRLSLPAVAATGDEAILATAINCLDFILCYFIFELPDHYYPEQITCYKRIAAECSQ